MRVLHLFFLVTLIVTTFLCESLFATKIPKHAKINTGTGYTSKAFGDDDSMNCPACLAFASALRTKMLQHQAPLEWSHAKRTSFLKREDRVADVLEEGIQLATKEYVWVDEAWNKTKRPGRYWHHKVLRQRGGLKPETVEQIDKYIQTGGDPALGHFIRMHIVDPNEAEVEDYIQMNITDAVSVQRLLCYQGTSHCEGIDSKEVDARDEL
eukprot:PhF_6_TR43514/c0_g1_i1/m.66798